MFNTFQKPYFFRKTLASAVGILAAASLLTSCLDNLDSPALPPAAYVSIYQGATTAPAMDVFANQNRVNQNPVEYTNFLAYAAFYTGDRRFRFSPSNSATALLEKDFKLKPDSVYSVFLADESPRLDAILVKDVWENPVSEKAQIRLVHLSPNTEAVNLEISGVTTPLISGSSFKSASTFVPVNRGTATLTIKSVENGQILVQSGTLDLKGNHVYTLILRGLKGRKDGIQNLDIQLITNYIKP
jgi:hypothetical protein